MNKDLKGKFAFTLGATHVGIFHNIGGIFHKLVESFTHVGISHNIGGTFHKLVESFTHVGIFNNTRRVGFTLAEVLITLGIIGVVSAMTIPNLISKYQERATVTKVKQAYSILSQAYRLAIAKNGPIYHWDLEVDGMYDAQSHINLANYLKPFLRLNHDCTGKEVHYVYKHCNAQDYAYAEPDNYAVFVLSNGMVVFTRIYSPNGLSGYLKNKKIFGTLSILDSGKDIQSGKNYFSFYITENGIVPFGVPEAEHSFAKACNPNIEVPYPAYSYNTNMYGCTAWVIQKENMDYWECPEKLGWNKASSCDE